MSNPKIRITASPVAPHSPNELRIRENVLGTSIVRGSLSLLSLPSLSNAFAVTRQVPPPSALSWSACQSPLRSAAVSRIKNSLAPMRYAFIITSAPDFPSMRKGPCGFCVVAEKLRTAGRGTSPDSADGTEEAEKAGDDMTNGAFALGAEGGKGGGISFENEYEAPLNPVRTFVPFPSLASIVPEVKLTVADPVFFTWKRTSRSLPDAPWNP